ncbi:MAG: acetate--CoA ligase family protein [Haloarculaceae archaeon]
MADLSTLFEPDVVAVVGATERSGSVGRAVMENLSGFDGDVIPVNPNAETVLGRTAYPDLRAAPPVDLAVVVVPASAAVEVVREAGEVGVESVVVITAGFREAGADGAVRERELREAAAEYDVDLVGPNCLGVIGTERGLNATFAPQDALQGSVSFMSQSGAFVTSVLDWAADQGVGFHEVVSLGNKAVLDETDFVAHWGSDEGTDVVLAYLESIEDGRAFIEVTRDAARHTPVVVVKSGRTEAGAHAAASHTGAIAGSERAYEAGIEQAGALRVQTVQELFDFAEILSGQPLPADEGVAIVTNAGGLGVMATDAVGDSTLELASFADETVDALQDALPAGANVYNPVDVIGDARVERFRTAIDLALADPNVGAAVVLSAPTAVLSFTALAEAVVEVQAEHGKPVSTCLMGGQSTREPGQIMGDAGVPMYFDPARAVRSLDALARYRRIREREYEAPTTFDDVDPERARSVLATAAEAGRTKLGVEAMDLLAAYGIPVPEGEVCADPERAREVAATIEGDVVMKIVSPDILHKTDIGGVKVGVSTDEVFDAYEDLVTRARNYQPDATILGVQVQELVDLDDSVETIVGANRDSQFGPLLLFGLGGVFVEVLQDTTLRVAPVGESEAAEMVAGIDAAPLLRGARGRAPVDEASLVETIQRLSQLVTDFPAILELDVNPLAAAPDGATALDVRLTIDPDAL